MTFWLWLALVNGIPALPAEECRMPVELADNRHGRRAARKIRRQA